ncbi:cytochrome c oxidase accessory protein CcoG [Luteolibacter sp. AS25]|uniref:cytochrome c oxidase accessory protein CcoG n=1 Tax=Luteolibacter sp. AS25 TaxID=3135776 RepID=UPI00398B9EE0
MSSPKQQSKRPNLVSVTTINPDGSHYVLHPADVKGRFTSFRRIFGILLIAVYVLLPWIPINGAPALFFDVENRKFHMFGLTLLTQDLWVFFFAVSGLGFILFFITALLGRLWCGWACPYTVFLEHVFRRIERWIDGDATARRKLDAAPSSARKTIRRIVKYSLYLIASAIIAHVFISYFVSLPRLYEFMQEGPLEHGATFTIIAALTGTLYFCFAWFREQFCIILCPYGRIQSALTDEETVVIGYDEKRGEPRGKATDPNAGACVDCTRCVQVCPTGIDIRNGLQMECIGCAACIDACDDIMRKLKRPTGLVRYDSTSGLAGKKRRILRPRLFLYTFLGILGMAALGTTAYLKAKPMLAEVSRMRGAPFFVDPGAVRNHYELRVQNKRNQPVEFKITLENPPPGFTLSGLGDSLTLGALDETSRPLIIVNKLDQYKGPTQLTMKISATPGKAIIRQKLKFLGPNPNLTNQ